MSIMTPDRGCQHTRRVRLKLRNAASGSAIVQTVRFARTRPTGAIERIAFFWVMAFVTAAPATGQPEPPTTPQGYRLLRYEEDYSHVCDTTASTGMQGSLHLAIETPPTEICGMRSSACPSRQAATCRWAVSSEFSTKATTVCGGVRRTNREDR